MLEIDFVVAACIVLFIALIGNQAIFVVLAHTADVAELADAQKKLILCSEELLNNPGLGGAECNYKISKTPTEQGGLVLRRLVVRGGEVILLEVW